MRIDLGFSGHGLTLGDQLPSAGLRELAPMEVFERCYERRYAAGPPEDLRTRYAELVVDAQRLLEERGS